MILKYNEFLIEYNKYIETVYHMVDFEKLNYILDNNKITSYNFSKISTTRDPFLYSYVGDKPTSIFKLELDYQKLAKDYDINEFVYVSRTNVSMEEEEEEQINTNEIKNIDKYINRIIIIKNKLENLKDSGWFNSRGGFYKNTKTNIPILLKEIIDKSPYDFWIEDGKRIYKDDEYVNDILNSIIAIYYKGYAIYNIKEMYDYYEINGKKTEFKKRWNEYIPVDINNETINMDTLTIGLTVDNIFLNLKKPDKSILTEDTVILEFNFDIDDLISINNNYIHLKKAKIINCIKKHFNLMG